MSWCGRGSGQAGHVGRFASDHTTWACVSMSATWPKCSTCWTAPAAHDPRWREPPSLRRRPSQPGARGRGTLARGQIEPRTSPVGIPWQSIGAFLRIATHPRASARPLSPHDAWTHVSEWLGCDVAWTPQPTERHAEVLGGLVSRYRVSANLVPDAM